MNKIGSRDQGPDGYLFVPGTWPQISYELHLRTDAIKGIFYKNIDASIIVLPVMEYYRISIYRVPL